MHGAPELLRRRLWRAVARRRSLHWLAVLLPLLAALALLPAMRQPALLLLLAWAFWLAVDIRRWRSRIAHQWTNWLDAAVPALEDSSALLGREQLAPLARLQRERLLARLHDALGEDDYRTIARQRVRFALLPLLLAIAAAGALWAWPGQRAGKAPQTAAAPLKAIIAGEVYLRVTPPAYTGAAAFETAARDIQVPQFSELRWCVRPPSAAAPVVELSDGQALTVDDNCARLQASETLFWRVRGKATRYNVRVQPDQPPQVGIVAPNEAIHVLAADSKSVLLSVLARDDYAVVRASLHMTLARGSGENIRFSDREVPLPQSADPRTRQWQKQWTLAELGMEPGDELYFFVRATDNAPGQAHTSQSPTYTLRLPGPESEALDSSAVPTLAKPENLRSQRQIIIDTEQLLADLKAQPRLASLRERSEGIAADQAQLRLRYGQFLGEESSLFGEEHEHEHESAPARPGRDTAAAMVAEFGHAHDQEDNATIFDPKTKAVLKRALAAMWDAEKQLRAIAPAGALAPEYKALEAIKELQQAERVYLHRTAFVPPALKEEKRMSGDIVGALSYKRAQGRASETVPAEVRELLQALAGDGALPALWSKLARDTIATRIGNEEQKLAAQRAVQDVADGCNACRPALRAWLRSTLSDAPALLQASPAVDTRFRQVWRGKEQP